MNIKDIENLATLCRIDIEEEEKLQLLEEMNGILGYIGKIQEVVTEEQMPEVGGFYNIMREDKDPYESGFLTEDIVSQMPDSKDKYLKVKKIL